MSAVTVPSKNCLEMLDDFMVCCECCITEHEQAVPHSVCAEPSFRTRSTGKDILRIDTCIVAENCDLKFINEQIKFSPLVISSISLLSNLILSLRIFTRTSRYNSNI
jgi:hypothetical protein